jgi:PAS domain S-box-containing protein
MAKLPTMADDAPSKSELAADAIFDPVELAKRGLRAEHLFRLLVESVTDYAIFVLDPTGHITTWNVGARRIKGYQPNEILGRHLSTFYPEEDIRAGKVEHELEVAARVGRFEDEGWRIRKDGSRFWANVIISAMRDDTGKLVGFSKVTRDLTTRIRAEEERAARLAAEQANRAKDEFLAMLGHELRNPLAPIDTALQLMRLRGDQTLSKELAVIERQVAHMTGLVDDLLDVARVTRGLIELRRRAVDLGDVLAKAIETVSPVLEQRHHHLEIAPHDPGLLVDGDETRLAQIVTNLLTNAAKYMDPGGTIWIRLARDRGDVVLEVRDAGQGIEPELLPRVFDLFVQGSQGRERAGGGLGLGLALVRRLVTLHGGRVEARSDGRGKGSTFEVRLPVASGTVDRATPVVGATAIAASPPHHRRRILIVDDNQDAGELLADVLMSKGHEVRTAVDAASALEITGAGFTADIAILDIGLPVVDGYELAAMLRARTAPAPRLIALTGYGQLSDIERSTAAGFAVHLVKPVNMAKLLASLDALDA